MFREKFCSIAKNITINKIQIQNDVLERRKFTSPTKTARLRHGMLFLLHLYRPRPMEVSGYFFCVTKQTDQTTRFVGEESEEIRKPVVFYGFEDGTGSEKSWKLQIKSRGVFVGGDFAKSQIYNKLCRQFFPILVTMWANYLVGGFNPFEKYSSSWFISPGRGKQV